MAEEVHKKIQDHIYKQLVSATPVSYEDSCFTPPGFWMEAIMGKKSDPQPTTETTHSAVLEFPNGDMVTIPPPEGDDWESEIVFDEWTIRDPDEWGHFAQEINRFSMNIVRRDPSELADDTWNCFCHQPAMLIIKEYEKRIFDTEPRVLSLTKHTRTYTPTIKTEDRYTELDNYPLLNKELK